jgi:ubiquinone/menaquinone biosynthesis C-methylase UbiE
LDFGCGWGRITRFFVKDIEKGQLYGVDPLAEIIELCKSTVKLAKFDVIEPLPPIPQFSPNMFDIVYAYSVFSHLNEQYTYLWFHEFNRLLKKGGLLIVTTRSRSFIEHTALLRRPDANPASPRSSVQSFVNTQQVLKDYDAGKYCHQPTGGGDILSKEFFGETCIPKKYFEQNFSDIFIIDDFIENLTFEPNQACIILRKR